MPRYKIIIEYNGTPFVGWQKQDNGLSVQEAIELKIQHITKQPVSLYGSGRTDAGVHALYQVAHFDLDIQLDTHKFIRSLNHFLADLPISIIDVEQVDDNFHARFDAKKRSYVYKILNRKHPSTLLKDRAWHVIYSLNINEMREASKFLIGKHDFSSMRASSCQAKSAIRTIDSIEISKERDIICITVTAPSFLHNQIRILIGLLVEIGKGALAKEMIPEILAAKSRTSCPYTAPAHGLYYLGAEY